MGVRNLDPQPPEQKNYEHAAPRRLGARNVELGDSEPQPRADSCYFARCSLSRRQTNLPSGVIW